VKIKRGTADRGAVQHILHRDIFDRLFIDQSHECAAESVARAPCAFIGFARLPVAANASRLRAIVNLAPTPHPIL
jgi:hypothetical protein